MTDIIFLADRRRRKSRPCLVVLLKKWVILKAIAYHIEPHEKESLILANEKKHDLTLISNDLNDQTVVFSAGKETVIVSVQDELDQAMLEELWLHGVKRIITRSTTTDHIDLKVATRMGFKIAHVPQAMLLTSNGISKAIIDHLDAWEQGHCLGEACACDKVRRLDSKKKVERSICRI